MQLSGGFHVFVALAILLQLHLSSGDDGNVTDPSGPADPSNQIVRSMQGQGLISPGSCADLQLAGRRFSGTYTIQLLSKDVEVYCDLETDGGGWTVFQRRDEYSPRLGFYKNWFSYKTGFGDRNGEFWLGLDNIHALSSVEPSSLRVDLEDFEGGKRYAKYSRFYVSDEANKYRLLVSGYSADGGAGDSLTYQNRQQFSTFDRDNDMSGDNCAAKYVGAWWYNRCHMSNLNGEYLRGKHTKPGFGVEWKTWHGDVYSHKKTEMKIRPMDFFS